MRCTSNFNLYLIDIFEFCFLSMVTQGIHLYYWMNLVWCEKINTMQDGMDSLSLPSFQRLRPFFFFFSFCLVRLFRCLCNKMLFFPTIKKNRFYSIYYLFVLQVKNLFQKCVVPSWHNSSTLNSSIIVFNATTLASASKLSKERPISVQLAYFHQSPLQITDARL